MSEPGNESPRAVVGVLGPVTLDGSVVPGTRAQRLLVALALAGGRSLSAERLIDEVWDEDPPRSPGAALHTQISRLRSFVAPARIDGADGRYRLTGIVTDLDLAADHLAAGDAAAAAALWRGLPGDELGSSSIGAELAERARRLRDRVDDALAREALARHDFDVAAELARERIQDDELDETAVVVLMRALAGLGRVNEALTAYARLRRALSEHLGTDPGPEAADLNAQLLAGPSAPTAAAASPAPTSPAHSGTGLRDIGNDLIGRSADLDAIASLLESCRVVTVQGPGGVGKTRIATEIGRRLVDAGRAVYFVPLASVRDGDDLLATVAGALGVGESEMSNAGPRTVRAGMSERLRDALSRSSAVLVLDNCEQVIGACAELVDSILAAGPAVRVLTTSRSPLLIPAEQVYQLPVLTVDGDHPSAVELFRQRARAVRPDADLDADTVAELCAHLDGLPLAIELAAVRVRTMSVAEITARLSERFELLRSADRTAPDRHRTLSAVIEWSWNLLDDASRVALARLCLFPSGFSRDGARRATGMSGVALDDALAALADQSLLHVYDSAGQTRFRMLETVREFGEQRLRASDENEAVVAAMRAWATDFARDLRLRYESSSDDALVRDTEREIDNLIWALRSALGAHDEPASITTVVEVFPVVGAYWATRGLHPEVQNWGRRVLDALPSPPPDLDGDTKAAWQASVVIAVMHLMTEGVLRPIAKGRMLLRRLADRSAMFDEPFELLAAMTLCRSESAFYRLVVQATAADKPTKIRALGLAIRLNMKENYGDLAGATRDSELLGGLPLRANSFLGAMTDMATASVHSQQGHWQKALGLYEASRRRLHELGAADDLRQVCAYIVANRIQLGEFDRARADLDVVRDGWRPGDPTPQGNPETIAVMMLVTAEYLRTAPASASADLLADGVDVAGVYRQAGEALLAGHPLAARDPGAVMTIAAVAAGLLSLGDADGAAAFADAVLIRSDDVVGSRWVDIPQTGNLALVTGAAACARTPGHPDGVALLVLCDRLRARHDYPAMHQLLLRRRDLSGADDEGWARAVEAFGGLSRRRALAETQRILGERTVLG